MAICNYDCFNCIFDDCINNFAPNRDKILAEWRQKNKAKISAQQKEYRQKNRAKILAHKKEYYQRKKLEKNKDYDEILSGK